VTVIDADATPSFNPTRVRLKPDTSTWLKNTVGLQPHEGSSETLFVWEFKPLTSFASTPRGFV